MFEDLSLSMSYDDIVLLLDVGAAQSEPMDYQCLKPSGWLSLKVHRLVNRLTGQQRYVERH